MEFLLTIALWAFLIALIVGLTDPSKVVFGEVEPTRRNVFSLYGSGFTLCFAIFSADSILSFFSYFLVIGTLLGFIVTIFDPKIFSQKWGRRQLLPLWAGGFVLSFVIMGLGESWVGYGVDVENARRKTLHTTSKSTPMDEFTKEDIPSDLKWTFEGIALGKPVEEIRPYFTDWKVVSNDLSLEVQAKRNGNEWRLVFHDNEDTWLYSILQKQFCSWQFYQATKQGMIQSLGYPDRSHTPTETLPFYLEIWETGNEEMMTRIQLGYNNSVDTPFMTQSLEWPWYEK